MCAVSSPDVNNVGMQRQVQAQTHLTFFFRGGKMASGAMTSLYCSGIVSAALP